MSNDIHEFARIFDKLITSKDASIQNSLRELLVIATLSDKPMTEQGPFASLLDELDRMRTDLDRAMQHIQMLTDAQLQKQYDTIPNNTYKYHTTSGTAIQNDPYSIISRSMV